MIRACPRNTIVQDHRGATVVEFAIILPTLCALLCAGLELGYRAYLTSQIQWALLEASRLASVGNKTEAQINAVVRKRVGVLNNAANVKSIVKQNFYNFTNVGKPEKITSDTDPKGTYNSTDCYEDANNNGVYDTRMNSGLGTADDIVRYTITVTYPNIMPVSRVFGWGSNQSIGSSTVLRNQPFTSRAAPTIRCS